VPSLPCGFVTTTVSETTLHSTPRSYTVSSPGGGITGATGPTEAGRTDEASGMGRNR
jgi:hypothetical protein